MIAPHNRKTTSRDRRNRCIFETRTARDGNLALNWQAIGIETTGEHVATTTVIPHPRDHKSISQRRYIIPELVGRGGRVDRKFRADLVAD